MTKTDSAHAPKGVRLGGGGRQEIPRTSAKGSGRETRLHGSQLVGSAPARRRTTSATTSWSVWQWEKKPENKCDGLCIL